VGTKEGRKNKMKKNDFIAKYGKEAYAKRLWKTSMWQKAHPTERGVIRKKWNEKNLEKIREFNQEHCRKGGKYYEKTLKYNQTGISGERAKIRTQHANKWRPYKKIIALDSQLHHQWRSGTSEYDGLALVEKNSHMHGIIDVIQILEGEITLLTEEEIQGK
jgi:hypothetical protein